MIAYTSYVTECRARLEAEALVKLEHEVFFLVLKERAVPTTYTDHGVTVVELNLRKYRGKSSFRYILSYLVFLALAFLACTRLFVTKNISIVHVHNMPDILVFAGLIPRVCGRTVILDIHDSMPETYLGKFATDSRLLFHALRWEEKVCCWFANRVVCVNHPQKKVLVERGIPAQKIFTILSIPKFTSQKQAAGEANPEIFRLVYHGTISKRLGLDLAVEAVAELVQAIPGLEFHIYGSGDDLDDVLHRAAALGITNHIHFRGIVDWESLPEELKTMDAGIVPNRRNVATELMLPAKLMDYVSLEIPAIAPRLKAIQYYFSGDMVSYFEPEDLKGMAAAILRLYRDPARRRRQAIAAKSFLTQYRWDNWKWGLRQLYTESEEEFVEGSGEALAIEKSHIA